MKNGKETVNFGKLPAFELTDNLLAWFAYFAVCPYMPFSILRGFACFDSAPISKRFKPIQGVSNRRPKPHPIRRIPRF
jgi:hypothetical protein